MFSFKVGNITIYFNIPNQKKLFAKISWSSIVVITIAISAVQLLFMDICTMVRSVVICTLVGLVSYYYLLLYYRVVTGKKILGTNYIGFWTLTVSRNHSSRHQIKIVFFEEMFFRVVPVYILMLFNMNNLLGIAILTIIFVLTHINLNRQNNFFSLIELFIFFFPIALAYNRYMFLPILFIPHFIRNLCIDEVLICLRKQNM